MASETKEPIEREITQKLDIRGQICPYTLIETRDTLKTLPIDSVLEVLCDYEPAATATIPSFCTKKQYPLEIVQEGASLWRLYIRKLS